MTTLNDNYQRNIDILKENLKRGMTAQQAQYPIDGMEKQFVNANLYNDEAQAFIKAMRQTVKDHFAVKISATEAMRQLGIEIVRIA